MINIQVGSSWAIILENPFADMTGCLRLGHVRVLEVAKCIGFVLGSVSTFNTNEIISFVFLNPFVHFICQKREKNCNVSWICWIGKYPYRSLQDQNIDQPFLTPRGLQLLEWKLRQTWKNFRPTPKLCQLFQLYYVIRLTSKVQIEDATLMAFYVYHHHLHLVEIPWSLLRGLSLERSFL